MELSDKEIKLLLDAISKAKEFYPDNKDEYFKLEKKIIGEGERIIVADLGVKDIIEIWNDRVDKRIPLCRVVMGKRATGVRARMKEFREYCKKNDIKISEYEFVVQLIDCINNTPFLLGDNKRGWKVNFDFVFCSQGNWVKIIEGNYDTAKRAGIEKAISSQLDSVDLAKKILNGNN